MNAESTLELISNISEKTRDVGRVIASLQIERVFSKLGGDSYKMYILTQQKDYNSLKKYDANVVMKIASIAGELEVLEYFYNNNIIQKDVLTKCLEYSVRYSHERVFKFLVKKGASIDDEGLLFKCIESDNLKMFRYILSKLKTINRGVMSDLLGNSFLANARDISSYITLKFFNGQIPDDVRRNINSHKV